MIFEREGGGELGWMDVRERLGFGDWKSEGCMVRRMG